MEKKKKLIILGIILLLIIVSGATFAILTWNSTMIKLGINTNCFTIDYTRGGDIIGSLKLINWGDIYSEEDNAFTIKKGMGLSYVNVGINSNCSIEGYGTIYLNVTELSDTFKDGGESFEALRYAILKNTSSLSNNNITIDNLENQSFEMLVEDGIIETGKIKLYSEQLSNTEVNKYLVVIFVINEAAGNDVTEATFKGNISVEVEQERYGETPSYCFNLADKDEENKTASLATMGYNCYAGNNDNYETITDVVIPSTIDGYKITKINDNFICKDYGYLSQAGREVCKANINELTSIKLPNSVTTIGDYALNGNQLTSITIPDTVVTIGSSAFYGNQLISVTLGNSLTTIGQDVFANNQLTNVVIPDSVTTIGSEAFAVNKLTSVVIPEVTIIEEGTFRNNQLTNIIIPNSVTTIGQSAFSSNKLTSINIPDSVTEIGRSAFANNQLTSATIPNSVTSLSGFNNNQLTSIVIPDSVTTIENSAFSYNNLNYVYIGNNSNLISIGRYVFSSSNRTNTDNDANITYVDNPNLKTIYYNGSNSLTWDYAINGESKDYKFVTGIASSYTDYRGAYNEVLITTGK